jgi:hypothetical protein
VNIKAITAVFSFGVVGIVVCLGMTIYTGIQEHQAKSNPAPLTIPTPAVPR